MTQECNCNWVTKTLGDGCSICNPQLTIAMLREEVREFEQRIAELEAPKTCEGCKHMYYWIETDIVECDKNKPPLNWDTMKPLNMFEVTYDFGCINYEPKEAK